MLPQSRGGRGSSVRAALTEAAALLQSAGIPNPRLEARILLAHAVETSVEALLSDPQAEIDPTSCAPLLARRAAHEPLALILGHREFWSIDFQVSPATLVPRPESETVIEAAIMAFENGVRPRQILDLGTGTGCLLLSALHEFADANGIGLDRSAAAVDLARRNAAMLGLTNRAAFVCGDWGASLCAHFDLILCNPPYVATPELATLMPEVRCYEPATALDGGQDGIAAYRTLIPVLPGLLSPGGVVILELGQGQAEIVTELGVASGFIVTTRRDLSGIQRAIVLRRLSS